MDGRLILDAAAPGAWNMAVDEALLRSGGASDEASLRFYRWSAPTLSLGYFQNWQDRAQHLESRDCALVRRSSGGGAIMHHWELTYALVLPRSGFSLTSSQAYACTHEALCGLLAEFAVVATLAEGSASGEREPFLCFQRRAEGDVLVGEHKIAGSAQRRKRNALLQHGSLLLRRSPHAPQLAGLTDLSAEIPEYSRLQALWAQAIGERLGIDWRAGSLTAEEREAAEEIQQTQYASDAWTRRR